MGVGLLDVNDSNLQLWHQDTHVQSPGYALLQGSEYVFGAPARATARLKPRDINTRFWWQLSTEALQPALGPARHSGDLVHAHLKQLHQEGQQPDEVLLAVSGSMQHQQLSLLLGIVQECPFNAVGLVNRSVALASLYDPCERFFHLEIQLHQALLSELSCSGNQIALARTVPLPGYGLLQLQERLVEMVALEFVRQTRFDPRRKADTEQQLYDALPAALLTLQNSPEANLDVNGYQARVSAQQLQAAGSRLFNSARETIGQLQPNDLVLIDPLAALLPGHSSVFERMDMLQPDDLPQALKAHHDLLIQREQSLSFVNALPCLGQKPQPGAKRSGEPASARPATAAPSIPATAPTHVLYENVAQPLRESGTALAEGWELHCDHEGWQLRGSGSTLRVNGAGYSPGQILCTGDAIVIGGGTTALLIEVRM